MQSSSKTFHSAQILRRLELLDTDARKERVKGETTSGMDAAINVTPLVDVVLVLLIIFMVVTPMLDDGIELPRAYDLLKVSNQRDDLKISIKRDGIVRVDNKEIKNEELKEKLLMEMQKNPFRQVYV